VALVPRRVGHFRDEIAQGLAVFVEAVVTGQGVYLVTEVAQVRQQVDRPRGAFADLALDAPAYGLIEGERRVAVEVLAPEARRCQASAGPEGAQGQHCVEFAEMQKGHEHAVAERVWPRQVAAMAQGADVES
jgi:hypothetical protein